MYKIKILYLILILLLLYCKNKTENSENENFSFIRGKNIHLRESANQKSKSFGFLQGGNKVEIISEPDTKTKVGNLDGKWIKVIVLSGKLEKITGYVFSTFILDRGTDPMNLINKDIEISKRKDYLLKLKSEFKEYDEGGQYTFDELIDFEILITECKINRIANPTIFKERETLIKNFRALQRNFNNSEFEKMTSCEFLWAEGCGGNDFLPYPYFSYPGEAEMKQIIESLIVDSGDKDNCYRTSENDNKRYCFEISKNDEKYQISGICQLWTNQN